MNDVWQQAKAIAELLPENIEWCFLVTDLQGDAIFNIYVPHEAWHAVRVLLSLPRPEFRFFDDRPGGVEFEEYDVNGLIVTLITPEVTDESVGPDA